MKTLKKLVFAAILALGAAGFPGNVRAEGLLLGKGDLAKEARAALLADVAAARSSFPSAFAAVATLAGHRAEFYKDKRNPTPSVDRELRALGEAGLFPMLEAIALEEKASLGITEREREALVVGLVAAVGVLRDTRSAPVLLAVYERSAAGSRVEHAAAEALGRLCGDAALKTLAANAKVAGARRLSAIAGLGVCRRLESAQALAAVVSDASSDAGAAQAATRALGTLGSSWGWKALGPSAEARGEVVRKLAAEALVGAFVRGGDVSRDEAARALSLVEHPASLEAISRALPGADPTTSIALRDLHARLERVIRR